MGEEGQGNQRLLGLGPMTQVQVRGWPQVWARLGCTVWGCWGMQVAQLEEAAAAHAQEVKRLREQAGDLGRQRESCLREVSRPPTCLLAPLPQHS